jgi:AraC-like DNA-binding protein
LISFYSIGHFINQPNNPTEFEVFRFDEIEEPEVDDLHKHTFYEIIWIEEGESRQIIDYKEYEVKPQSLFFISQGQLHHFEEWKPITGGCIMFTEDFFLLNQQDKNKLFELSFLDNLHANACITPDPKSYQEIKQTIDAIYNEHFRKDRSASICQSLLQVLMTQVQRAANQQSGNEIPTKHILFYKKFNGLLEKHFQENKLASEYAEMLNITAHHLNHVLKLVTGKTSTEVIRERSILEAKRLLTFTDLTVSEIASQLNYFVSSYFAKLFKLDAGVSPSDFKKTISEKYRIS